MCRECVCSPQTRGGHAPTKRADITPHATSCAPLARMPPTSQASRCGFFVDCPRAYSAQDVLEGSASSWGPNRIANMQHLGELHVAARSHCSTSTAAGPAMKGLNGGEGFLKSGGWCLRTKGRPGDPYDVVRESNGQSYFLPHPHLAPDSAIVDFLTRLLKTCRDPPACQTHQFLSLNDFGAGVGQYGRAILARDPRYRLL